MIITDIKFWKSDRPGAVLGKASVTFDNQLVVTGFTVINGQKGMFASFPQKKSGEEWKDSVFSLDKEFRTVIMDAIIRQSQQIAPPQTPPQNNFAAPNPYDQTPPPQPVPNNGYADQQNFQNQPKDPVNNYQPNELPFGQPAPKQDNPWGLVFGPWNGPERIAMSNATFSKAWQADKENIKKAGYVTYKDGQNFIVKQFKKDDFAGGAPMGSGNPM